MNKLLLFLCIFLVSVEAFASAPTRPNSYVSGTVIDPVAVTQNETTIYTYLQAGVDTYSPLSITNASISNTAGITYAKLNLGGGLLPSDFNTTTTTSIYQFENVTVPSTGTINYGTNHIGDILVDNGTTFTRLVEGAIGTVLVSQGSGSTAPIYSFPSGQLGAWTSKAENTIFQATTDGFVTADVNSGSNYTVKGFTDGSNPPTTQRQTETQVGTNPTAIAFPVKKGDFYEVTASAALSVSRIFFISIGS